MRRLCGFAVCEAFIVLAGGGMRRQCDAHAYCCIMPTGFRHGKSQGRGLFPRRCVPNCT